MNTHAEGRFKEHLEITSGQKTCYNLGERVKNNRKNQFLLFFYGKDGIDAIKESKKPV